MSRRKSSCQSTQSGKDQISLNSDTSSGTDMANSSVDSMGSTKDRMNSSVKSQSDSGIGQEDGYGGGDKGHCTRDTGGCGDVRDSKSDMSLSSDTSDGLSAEAQLQLLLARTKAEENVKERTSSHGSNRSAVSIEMDGDNLLVVTEELEDDAIFEEDSSSLLSGKGTLNGGHNQEVSSSSDSTQPSPNVEHYTQMIQELQAGLTNGNGDQDHHEELRKSKNNSKNLALNLNQSSLPREPITTPDIAVSPVSSGSSSTSGPDSRPPSPFSDYEPSSPEGSVGSGSAVTHNLTFPENSITYSQSPSMGDRRSAKEQTCGVFSVDLGKNFIL